MIATGRSWTRRLGWSMNAVASARRPTSGAELSMLGVDAGAAAGPADVV